jgi:hypothetical protein
MMIRATLVYIKKQLLKNLDYDLDFIFPIIGCILEFIFNLSIGFLFIVFVYNTMFKIAQYGNFLVTGKMTSDCKKTNSNIYFYYLCEIFTGNLTIQILYFLINFGFMFENIFDKFKNKFIIKKILYLTFVDFAVIYFFGNFWLNYIILSFYTCVMIHIIPYNIKSAKIKIKEIDDEMKSQYKEILKKE